MATGECGNTPRLFTSQVSYDVFHKTEESAIVFSDITWNFLNFSDFLWSVEILTKVILTQVSDVSVL